MPYVGDETDEDTDKNEVDSLEIEEGGIMTQDFEDLSDDDEGTGDTVQSGRVADLQFFKYFRDSRHYKNTYFESESYVKRVWGHLDPINRCNDHTLIITFAEDDFKQMPQMVVGGATQIGKTMFKSLGVMVAMEKSSIYFGIPCVVVTHGVSGALELAKKIAEHIKDCGITQGTVMTATKKVVSAGKLVDESMQGHRASAARREILGGSGCIVIANTKYQIDKVYHDLCEVQHQRIAEKKLPPRIALFIDEADDMIRAPQFREDQSRVPLHEMVKLASALKKLTGEAGVACSSRSGTPYYCPALIVSVSATLIPVLAYLAENDNVNDESTTVKAEDIFLSIAPKGAYLGVESFEPLKYDSHLFGEIQRRHREDVELLKKRNGDEYSDGDDVFLHDRELRKQNHWITNKVRAMWSSVQSELALLLDITCGFVWGGDKNIHTKSFEMQTYFKNELEEKPLVVATHYGRAHNWSDCPDETLGGIRKNNISKTEQLNSKESVGEFLSRLDPQPRCKECDGCREKEWWCINTHRPEKQLCPIALFGYRTIIRGTSFRPKCTISVDGVKRENLFPRVPTHLVIQMGNGMSIEKMVQAFGRATYTNIPEHMRKDKADPKSLNPVTVLASLEDFNVAKTYPKLTRRIY